MYMEYQDCKKNISEVWVSPVLNRWHQSPAHSCFCQDQSAQLLMLWIKQQTQPSAHSEHHFPAPFSKLCQNCLRHWKDTPYLHASVHQCVETTFEPFVHQWQTVHLLTVFGDLWHNQLWQWLEEGCCKPVLGVWIKCSPCDIKVQHTAVSVMTSQHSFRCSIASIPHTCDAIQTSCVQHGGGRGPLQFWHTFLSWNNKITSHSLKCNQIMSHTILQQYVRVAHNYELWPKMLQTVSPLYTFCTNVFSP